MVGVVQFIFVQTVSPRGSSAPKQTNNYPKKIGRMLHKSISLMLMILLSNMHGAHHSVQQLGKECAEIQRVI